MNGCDFDEDEVPVSPLPPLDFDVNDIMEFRRQMDEFAKQVMAPIDKELGECFSR